MRGSTVAKAADAVAGGEVPRAEAVSTLGANVELYSYAGSQRANASDARRAQDMIDEAKESGALDAKAEVSVDNLKLLVADAAQAEELAASFDQDQAQRKRILEDDGLVAGFGNNGGEEYLSHLMTSESLIIVGGNDYLAWKEKMAGLLTKSQNPDGTWSGHHCITSPVFCTAAVLQCMTVERDAGMLRAIALADAKDLKPAADGKAQP
ncbi:MAG: hypothetical protein H0X45_10800 [Planctomycetes bacterium]|nr:hypothetical protein [Planctomycetota bacterium]